MAFSLLGVPIRVRPVFWLVTLLIAQPRGVDARSLVDAASWIVVVFLGLLAHELGHALAMRRVGASPSIELDAMGGRTEWDAQARPRPHQEMLVSLAGPAAGLLLGLPVAIAVLASGLPSSEPLQTLARSWLWVNVGWGAVNLLPMLPLDGGRVLELALNQRWPERGTRIASFVSLVIAAALAYAAWSQSILWPVVLLGWVVLSNLRTRPPEARAEAPAETAALDYAWRLIVTGHPDEASARIDVALAGGLNEATRARWVELSMWAHLEADREDEALRIAAEQAHAPSALLAARLAIARGDVERGLRALEAEHAAHPSGTSVMVLSAMYVAHGRAASVPPLLRDAGPLVATNRALDVISAALFYDAHYDESLVVCERGWTLYREARHAFNAACCCARKESIDEGLRWIASALDAGWTDGDALDTDEDLAPLRQAPGWRSLRARLPETT